MSYKLRIILEYFQPKIGRRIRIFSLGRKNNILIKKKECISFCTSNGKRKHNQVTQNSVSFSNQKKFQDVP